MRFARKIRLAIFLLLFVSFVVLIFWQYRSIRFKRFNFELNTEVKRQAVRERRFKDVVLLRERFGLSIWGEPFVDEKGNIYCWDYDFKIRKFSSDGKLLTVYGKGKGFGPGEFLRPISFTVDRFENLIVCDASNNQITIFDRANVDLKTFKLRSSPFKVGVSDSNIIVMKSLPADYIFEVYDYSGNLLRQFISDLIRSQFEFPIVLLGDFCVDGERIFYAPFYLGYLVCYNFKAGRFEYVVETMDRVFSPRLKIWESNGKRAVSIDERTPIATLKIYFDDGKIFVISGESLRAKQIVIDIYSSEDGRYLYSHKVPRKGFLKDGFFYENRDTNLIVWEVLVR